MKRTFVSAVIEKKFVLIFHHRKVINWWIKNLRRHDTDAKISCSKWNYENQMKVNFIVFERWKWFRKKWHFVKVNFWEGPRKLILTTHPKVFTVRFPLNLSENECFCNIFSNFKSESVFTGAALLSSGS